jgi:kynurenine formamidase
MRVRRDQTRMRWAPPTPHIAALMRATMLKNMKLDELSTKQAYEFTFVMPPIKLQGGTGSTVAPVAIR